MKAFKLKVKDKIMVYIIPIILFSLISITLLGVVLGKQIIMGEYDSKRAQVASHVINAVELIDAGYRMLEKDIEIEMEKKILEFKTEFKKAGGDPEKVSLEALKSKLGGKYDLIIIDADTTIIKATAPEGLNFNFMQFDKVLGEEINNIRLSENIRHERIRTNVGTGYLSKFSYIPTDDHKYLLELAYSDDGLGSILSEMEPLKIAEQLVRTNPIVSSIKIFDVYGYEFVNSGENYKPTEKSVSLVKRAMKEKQYEVKEGNKVLSYIFVDLKGKKQSMTDNSKIIEIAYDNTSLMNSLNRVTYLTFSASLAVILIIISIIFYLSNKITYPITLLSNAAKRVARGEYAVVAEKMSEDEIGELSDVFNIMAERIKTNFEKIEKQKMELEDYNKNLERKVDERTEELLKAKETIRREKYILERILDDTLSGYWDWDVVKDTEYLSPGFKKMLGYEEHELENSPETWRRMIFPEDMVKVDLNFRAHFESRGKVPFYNEVRYSHKNGSTIWVICAGHVVEWDTDNKPLQMVGCHINITDIKNLEKSLNEERELLRATLLSMGDGVISTNRAGKIEIMNAVAEKLTGWMKEDAYGRSFEDVFNIVNDNTGARCYNPIEKVIQTGEVTELDNHTILIAKDGYRRPIEDSAAPIKDEDGNLSGVVLVFRDFSEKKEKQEKIKYLSLHDQLTGLYNRRFLEEELKRLDSEKIFPLTLVMLDVNGLKLINDAFGHLMGDKVLQTVADITAGECSESDILARFGGDEFVIISTKVGTNDVEEKLKRINELVENAGVGSISLSISYGWITKQGESDSIYDMLKIAEDHMYRRKLSESKSMHYKTIEVILKTLHEKSEREKKHSERVSQLCEDIGFALNLKNEDIRELKTTGLMHDIGKIAIDLSILDKQGKLNEVEWTQIERHPELGYQILRSLNEFAKVAEYVLAHHERWDGNGYPRGIKGREIPLEARIVAVADAYDAMTSDRPYRKALSKEAAVAELEKNAGIQFDPQIVRIFIEKVL